MTLRKCFIGTAVVLAVVAAALLAPAWSARLAYALDEIKADTAAARLATVTDLSTAFENVAAAIKPSVVNISSVKKIEVRQTIPEPLLRGPFRDFFGDRFPDFFERDGRPRDYFQEGVGTGVIVSDDGYILTNNHVVEGADEVKVRLSDDRSFRAKVVGTDPKTDLAVIKVDEDGLHAARLGNSSNVRIGQWVVAVGNPFGLSHTLTAGIVSATGRSNMGIVDYEDFIQTDAAINPGNSGGPLVNLRGEVIGINTAIFSRSGGYMGLGFSIPINMAKSVMQSLIDDGRVVRGYLGAMIQNLDPGMADSFGFSGTDGALIGDVVSGGPAEEAGLKEGDIVTAYDGKPIENVTQLRSFVAQTRPGTKAALEVFRNGKHETLSVRIGELKDDELPASTSGQDVDEDLGLKVRTLTPELADRLGYDDVAGVVVTEVEPYSPAAEAGLQPRDVILRVAGKPVADAAAFRKALADNDLTQGVRLRIRSGDTERFAFLRVEK